MDALDELIWAFNRKQEADKAFCDATTKLQKAAKAAGLYSGGPFYRDGHIIEHSYDGNRYVVRKAHELNAGQKGPDGIKKV